MTDQKIDPFALEEDFYIPRKLPNLGGEDDDKEPVTERRPSTHEEDVEYFQNKLFNALKIPKKFLGFSKP